MNVTGHIASMITQIFHCGLVLLLQLARSLCGGRKEMLSWDGKIREQGNIFPNISNIVSNVF